MRILKKITGILLLIIAGISGLAAFLVLIRETLSVIRKIDRYSAFDFGYSLGMFMGVLFFSTIAYFSAKYGLRLVQGKKEEKESIDDIGKPEL
ncbi:hypothetical protein NAT51_05465 [Flavobacterium amniphilum]|uniref:hypothetical protein n=1 Tax=Flavobacterium amniphilum TaxID=1834035 RepID=UPI00202A941C|nr:hypothetical protein [Flavobacterium amniphilum]MCL9804955.1 hypothetical protein [Flavobacterium amniphilum]